MSNFPCRVLTSISILYLLGVRADEFISLSSPSLTLTINNDSYCIDLAAQVIYVITVLPKYMDAYVLMNVGVELYGSKIMETYFIE